MSWTRVCLRAASPEAIAAVTTLAFESKAAGVAINEVLIPVFAVATAAVLIVKDGAKVVRLLVDIFDGLSDLIRSIARTLQTWDHYMGTERPEPDEVPSPNKGPHHDKPDPTEMPKPKPSSVRSMKSRPHLHRKNRKRSHSSKKRTR